MPETNVNDSALLSNPSPSPLIDRDEPATKDTAKPDLKANPAPAADAKKADTPAATDDNAETPDGDAEVKADKPKPDADAEPRKESRRQRKLQREINARVAAEAVAQSLREQLAATQKPAATAEATEPQRDDFETYEAYLRAVTKFDAKQESAAILKAERDAAQQRAAQAKTQEGQKKQAEDWISREKEFSAKVPTFEDDVMPFVDGDLQELSKDARQLIVELGPEYLHKIATDDALIDELLALSPLRQVARIGRIDVTAAASAEPDGGAETDDGEADSEKAAPQKPKRADPPAPAKHVKSGRSAPDGYSDDQATYIEQRKKQNPRWARWSN